MRCAALADFQASVRLFSQLSSPLSIRKTKVKGPAASEVKHALRGHEAAGPPDHVARGEVDDEHPQEAVPHHGRELHALHEGAHRAPGYTGTLGTNRQAREEDAASVYEYTGTL